MATHSSTLAWKIPWTEEPGGLQSMESLRVGQTERLHFHFSFSFIGEGNGNPLQCSCLQNPRDRGAQSAAVYGVTQSDTTEATLQQQQQQQQQQAKVSAVQAMSETACFIHDSQKRSYYLYFACLFKLYICYGKFPNIYKNRKHNKLLCTQPQLLSI